MNNRFIKFTNIICISSLVIILGCKKQDALVDNKINSRKFFELPLNSTSTLKEVAGAIREHDKQSHVVNYISNNYGIPIWEKAISNTKIIEATNNKGLTENDTLIFYIPIQSQINQNITSFIFCLKINSTYGFRFMRKNVLDTLYSTDLQTKKYLNNSLAIIAAFERIINNRDSLRINGIYNRTYHNATIELNQTGKSEASASTYCYESSCGNQNTKSTVELCQHCDGSFTYPYTVTGIISWSYETSGGGPPLIDPVVDGLRYMLLLDNVQTNFLQNNIDLANDIMVYINTTSRAVEEAKVIAKEHIAHMTHNTDYYNFILGHSQSPARSQAVWWEDTNWLSDPNNFSLDLDEDSGTPPEQPNTAEKLLAAVFPIQAYQIWINKPIAEEAARSTNLPGPHNGKQDAFRHAFFQALNMATVPPRSFPFYISTEYIVREFANAHETSTPNALSIEATMDMFNNEWGIAFMCHGCNISQLSSAVLSYLNQGALKYLDPLNWTTSPRWPQGFNGVTSATQLKWTNQ